MVSRRIVFAHRAFGGPLCAISRMIPAVLLASSYALAGNHPFPAPTVDAPPTVDSKGMETAVLAGGCFWGVEAVFERVKGVKKAVSGFAGGQKKTAHYEEVSTGTTGHAESVQITFDPKQITYGQILMVYFSVAHDPTELNRQGPDTGTQYRSAIFYASEDQKKVAEAYIAQLDAAQVFKRKIVTQVVPLQGFYPAEAYHQHYLDHNMTSPYIVYNDLPKLAALKKQYPEFCKR
jgi:peptide-methionine (S)-S-oxide reductase